MKQLNIIDFGAVPGGAVLCTESIQHALDEADACGGTVVVPSGEFLTGTINLKGASLYLESGAVIKGSADMADYPEIGYLHNELGSVRSLIYSMNSKNISISGSGTIDLNGSTFFDFSSPLVPDSKVPFTDEQKSECTVRYTARPNQPIFFANVENIVLRDVTILDAPCWTVSFNQCRNVKVLGLTISCSLNIPNDDGIHVSSCKGIIISDCNISAGDDCIALSAISSWDIPCEDVVITNCILRSCSKALVIGYQYSIVRNVTISNVIINRSNRGFCIMSGAGVGLVENVVATNMIIDTEIRAGNWWGNGEAIFFMGNRHDNPHLLLQKPDHETDISVQNIHLSNIICTTENALGIIGENGNIRGISMRDITIKMKDSKNLPLKGRTLDVSPAKVTVELPEDKTCCLLIQDAVDVRLDGITVEPFHGIQPEIIIR